MDHKLGCRRSVADSRTLKLSNYIGGLSWIKIIPAADWMKVLPSPGILMNDKLGCCVVSGAMHHEMYWAANAGLPVPKASDEEVVSAYSAIGGYVPGDPSTDNGCDPLSALKYWRNTGITIGGKVHKIDGFARVNLRNTSEVRAALWLFGGLFAGWALPASAQGQGSWSLTGDPSDENSPAYPGSWGGHLAPLCEEDRSAFSVSTWGTRMIVQPEFLEQYCDEAWAVLSHNFISSNGISPSGFDMEALRRDISRL